jgi:6-phosphofructokinase
LTTFRSFSFSEILDLTTFELEFFMRIGVLTGGGDCPGLNAVIRAVVRKGVKEYGHEFVGFRDGWKGPLENYTMELNLETTRGILASRRNHFGFISHQSI